jgi:hypothetical protein
MMSLRNGTSPASHRAPRMLLKRQRPPRHVEGRGGALLELHDTDVAALN